MAARARPARAPVDRDAARSGRSRSSSSPPDTIDLAAIEAAVAPSPARAEPHDAAAWLPLPDDVDDLPPVHALLDPAPRGAGGGGRRGRGGRRRRPRRGRGQLGALAGPGRAPRRRRLAAAPARRRAPRGHRPPRGGHAAAADPPGQARSPAAGPPGARHRPPRRGHRAGRRLGRHPAPRPRRLPDHPRGRRHPPARCAPRSPSVGALLEGRSTSTLGPATSWCPSAARRAARRPPRRRAARRSPSPSTSTAASRTVRTVETTRRRAWPSSSTLGQAHRGAQPARPARGRLDRRLPHAHQRLAEGRRPDGHLRLAVAHGRRAAAVVQRARSAATTTSSRRSTPCSPTARRSRWCASAPTITQETRDDPVRHRASRPTPTFPSARPACIQDGKDGTMTVTYRQRVENGEKGDRTVISEVPTVEPTPDHRLRHLGRPALGRARRCASRAGAGTPSTAAPDGYDGGLGIYRGTWRAYGGVEFAPNAGLATREQQIIVGMRIYDELGWDPWGCANNVLALAAVEHVTLPRSPDARPGSVHGDGDAHAGDGPRAPRRARAASQAEPRPELPRRSQHRPPDRRAGRAGARRPGARDRSRPRLAHARAARRRRTTSSRSSSTTAWPTVLRGVLADAGADDRAGRSRSSTRRRRARVDLDAPARGRRRRRGRACRTCPTTSPCPVVMRLLERRRRRRAHPGDGAAGGGGAPRRRARATAQYGAVSVKVALLRRGAGWWAWCRRRCSCPGPRSTRRWCGSTAAPRRR